MNTPLNQVTNPTDEQRHEMLRKSLERAGRPEDYDYIVNLLSAPVDITNIAAPGELRGVKIGVIGGGLAGMCSAFELRKLGADITILDASESRIGGRVYTFSFDEEGKYYGEFGAMRIPVTHETSWHYINLFELNTQPLASPVRNNFLYVHNTRLRTSESIEQYLYPKFNLTTQEQNTPWSELSDYAFESRYRQLSPKVRAELISLLPAYSPEFTPLMSMNLRQNFEALGLSQGAIELISAIDSASGSLLHISYDEIAQGVYTLDYTDTYHIQNGNYNLPLAFYQSFQSSCPAGYSNIDPYCIGSVVYKPGHMVTGIYQSDYRNKVVVKYTSNSDANDSADIYDYVICAIPLTALRVIDIKPYFRNKKMQAIHKYNYIDAQKTLFLCNRRFWERNTEYGNIVGGISFTDLPIQSIIYPDDHTLCSQEEKRSVSNSQEYPAVLVSSYNLESNAVRLGGLGSRRCYELIRQNVEEIHGLPRGFLNSIVERYQSVHWNSEPLSCGAMVNTLPGQKKLFTYELQLPEYNGRVYFAGEHASSKHGWMQGALSSGKGAANRLAEHFHNQYRVGLHSRR